MPVLTSNYPAAQPGTPTLMSTPERLGALPEYTGKGVTLAFIDSGYYGHPDLRGRIVTHVDATTADITESLTIPKSMAFSWHGMMTSVICAGDGTRSAGKYRGIASSARLVLVKVSSPKNQIKEADILRGLEWVLANHRRHNIRVVNLSVGGDFVSFDNQHPLHLVIKRLVAQGVIVVAAAGNRQVNHLLPPASSAEAITVGGLDDNNTADRREWRLYGHNSGVAYDGSQKPDLVAPARWIASPIMPSTTVAWEAFWIGPLLGGDLQHPVRRLMESGSADKGLKKLFGQAYCENLLSTLQAKAYEHKLIDAYHQHVDGTSVAAPIVVSVIAQMLELKPDLTPAQVKAVLMKTAQKLENAAPERQGAGMLDAAAAVRAVERGDFTRDKERL
jgi:serine protease AprX